MKKILFMLVTLLTFSIASAQTTPKTKADQNKAQKDKTTVDKNRKMADTTTTMEKRKAKSAAQKNSTKPGKNDPNTTGSGVTPDINIPANGGDTPSPDPGLQPSGSVTYPNTPQPTDNKTPTTK